MSDLFPQPTEADRAWMDAAACIGADPDLFFPEDKYRGRDREAEPYLRAVAKAKEICATCPVRRECLEYALKFHEKFGVWGGLSEKERRSEARRRRRGVSGLRVIR